MQAGLDLSAAVGAMAVSGEVVAEPEAPSIFSRMPLK